MVGSLITHANANFSTHTTQNFVAFLVSTFSFLLTFDLIVYAINHTSRKIFAVNVTSNRFYQQALTYVDHFKILNKFSLNIKTSFHG